MIEHRENWELSPENLHRLHKGQEHEEEVEELLVLINRVFKDEVRQRRLEYIKESFRNA